MNIDRLPDNIDDPSHAADTTRLTEPSSPETPPPPESSPPKEDLPAIEESESAENVVQADDSPEATDTATPPPDPAEARETAEPRSRQEHADHPSADADAGAVDTRTEDVDSTAEAARELDHGADVTREGDKKEIGTAPENPTPDSAPNQEGSIVHEERDKEELCDQKDPPSDDAEDSGPADETHPPAPNDDAPAEEDRILPLTDKEWAEHVTEVRDTLDKARAAGLTTDRLYTIDPDHREWNAERNRIQGALIADLYEKAWAVPCDHQAVIAGGLGGAGKTTVLIEHAGIDLSKYLIINPDDIKEEMARRGMIPDVGNLSPMEASDLAHEESSYIAKRLAVRATADGKNIIWDITMSSQESTEERVRNLRDAAYSQVDGVFVNIPPALSIARTEIRHREGHEQWRIDQGLGGRFVPPEVIDLQADPEWGSQNRRTYETMKEKLDNWSIYDNSVHESPATLIDSSGQKKPGVNHTERPL